MDYEVLILRRAQKQLANLPKQNYARVRDLMIALGANPRPSGCKKLIGREGFGESDMAITASSMRLMMLSGV